MLPKEYKNIRLCILVPCYNEEESIEAFYAQLREVIVKYNYSILFIDDGSDDRTLCKLQALATLDNNVTYLSLSRNFGQHQALKAGYDHIHDADCIVSMDADLQHPPKYIDELVQKWIAGYEIVNTIRQSNHKIPFFKQFTAGCFYSLVNFISGNKIITNSPDYRLLDIKVVKAIRSINESSVYLKELVSWVGFKQCTVTFEVENRWGGKTKYSLKKQLALALTGITTFSISPLRLASLVGIAFSIPAFLYGLYALYVYFFTAHAVAGWTSLIASILFIAGLQFIMIGIMGEYLGKAFLEAKKRPLYLVRETSDDNLDKSPKRENKQQEQVFAPKTLYSL